MAASDVHRDLRNLAEELDEAGCDFRPRGGHRVDVYHNGIVVTVLPSRTASSPGDISSIRRRLQRMGVLATAKPDTTVGKAMKDAAKKAGLKPADHDLISTVAADPEAPDRGARKPREVGVLRPFDSRRSPAPSLRYIGNVAWGNHVVTRVKKHLSGFDTRMAFVEFAIEVARERRLPPPNTRRGAKLDPWDKVRIADVLAHLLQRKNARSLTLQFFSAACDELDGIPGGSFIVDRDGNKLEVEAIVATDEVLGVKAFEEEVVASATEEEAIAAPLEEVPESPGFTLESPEPVPTGDLKQRLAAILLDKLEAGDSIDESMVDRIERLISE